MYVHSPSQSCLGDFANSSLLLLWAGSSRRLLSSFLLRCAVGCCRFHPWDSPNSCFFLLATPTQWCPLTPSIGRSRGCSLLGRVSCLSSASTPAKLEVHSSLQSLNSFLFIGSPKIAVLQNCNSRFYFFKPVSTLYRTLLDFRYMSFLFSLLGGEIFLFFTLILTTLRNSGRPNAYH